MKIKNWSKLLLYFLVVICSIDAQAQTKEEFIESIELKISLKKYADADALVDKMLQIFPENEEAIVYKAHIIDSRGERKDAIIYAFQACEKYPKSYKILSYTASLCTNSSLFDTAFYFFDRAVTNGSTHEDREIAKVGIAAIYYYKENYDTSIILLNKLIEENPKCISCYNNLAMLYSRIKQDSIAVIYMKKAFELDSNNVLLCNNIGISLTEIMQYEEALAFFNKGIEIDKSFAYCYSNRGYCYLKSGKHSLAIKDLNKSIELDNQNSYAYRNRALVYLDQKLFSEACKDLQAAKTLGYKEFYGDEVNELIEKNCKK